MRIDDVAREMARIRAEYEEAYDRGDPPSLQTLADRYRGPENAILREAIAGFVLDFLSESSRGTEEAPEKWIPEDPLERGNGDTGACTASGCWRKQMRDLDAMLEEDSLDYVSPEKEPPTDEEKEMAERARLEAMRKAFGKRFY